MLLYKILNFKIFSRYVNALYYLFKRHEALRKGELEALQRSWEVMTACMTEVTSLRLYFAFLNVTPHLVLQLYFLLQLQTKVNFPEGNLNSFFIWNDLIYQVIGYTYASLSVCLLLYRMGSWSQYCGQLFSQVT